MGIQGRDYMRDWDLGWAGGDDSTSEPPRHRNRLAMLLVGVLILGVLVLLFLPS